MISPNLTKAVKVRFIDVLFEDDFVEKGMIAWLTKVEVDEKIDDEVVYKLHFDFTEFEAENDKFFTATYYSNNKTRELEEQTGRDLFTAKETGYYTPKAYFYLGVRAGETFESEIAKYLEVIENDTTPTAEELESFILNAGFRYGWDTLESSARKMAEYAVSEIKKLGGKV